jgi:DNA-binding IclR family transcriptional regulator
MAERRAESRDASVQVLGKAAALLDRLADEHELTASRLADLVAEPRSTVYRLLASLQALDLVEPGSQRGTYRLGLKLLRLGSAVVARFDERQAALPVMERIHQATGETVFLCVRRGDEAVCIERIDGRRVQSLALRLGGSLPLHAGAAPAVLLAYEPQEAWEEYVSRNELERFTEKTPATREAVFRHLAEVRRTGLAISDEDVTPGIAALGAPIFDYRGDVRAALSVSGVRPMILGGRTRQIRELVVEGAREISHALGFEGPKETAEHA